MGKKNKYTAQLKLTVSKFAEERNSAARHEFGINQKLARDWRKLINKLSGMPKAKCADRGKVNEYSKL